uniref:ShKT domain-containing protein n=1 Tax=Phaeodactylum tricornutum TaxID=2850 RepID=A0A8J9TAN3_PHATR
MRLVILSLALLVGVETRPQSFATTKRGECMPSSADLNHYVCFSDRPVDALVYQCADSEALCPDWAKAGECQKNPGYMQLECRHSCDTCVPLHVGMTQIAPLQEAPTQQQVHDRLVQTQQHVHNKAKENFNVLHNCLNYHELCTFWAVAGECDNSPDFMLRTCRPACYVC